MDDQLPEFGENIFGLLTGQSEINRIRTQIYLVTPGDLSAGANGHFPKLLLVIPEDKNASTG